MAPKLFKITIYVIILQSEYRTRYSAYWLLVYIISCKFMLKILNNIGDAVITTNLNFHISSWSESAEKLYGLKSADVLGKNIDEVVTSACAVSEEKVSLKEIIKNDFWKGELLQHRQDNSILSVISNIELTYDPSGRPKGYVIVNRDISLMRKIMQDFYKQDSFIQKVIDVSSSLISIYDHKTNRYIYVNNMLFTLLGYVSDDILDLGRKQFIQLIHPDDQLKVLSCIKNLASDGTNTIYETEFRIKHKNGKWKWLYSRYVVFLRNSKGRPLQSIGTSNDITKYRETEKELRKIAKSLNYSQELAHLGTWDWDILTGEVYWTDEFYRILGYEPQEIKPTSYSVLFNIHPEDVRMVERSIQNAINERRIWQIENRIIRKDGTIGYVISQGEVIFNNRNKPIRVTGIIQDISERKKVDEELRKEKETSQLYLKSTDSMFVKINVNCIVELINEKGCEILGYQEEEITGKNWFENFIPIENAEFTVLEFQKLIRKKSNLYYNLESPIIRKDGSQRMISWKNVLLFNEQNQVIATLWAGEDITERKKLENSIMNAVLNGKEQERKRIAHDLHDGLGQISTAIQLNLKALESELESLDEEKHTLLANAIELHETLTKEIRNISYDLISHELENFGLIRALESLFNRKSHTNFIKVNFFHFNIPDKKINENTENTLYRISQEILNNVLKHASATEVVFHIYIRNTLLYLTAQDNGVGFSGTLRQMQNKGIGLKELETRVKLLGGMVNISSKKGQGFSIAIKIPIKNIFYE